MLRVDEADHRRGPRRRKCMAPMEAMALGGGHDREPHRADRPFGQIHRPAAPAVDPVSAGLAGGGGDPGVWRLLRSPRLHPWVRAEPQDFPRVRKLCGSQELMPRVSVIIPAFCSTGTLPQCLARLREQRFRDFEVVLVNSSPEPATADLTRRHFPEARFEQSPVRLLPHAARNAGVRLAQGEILVFTDPDCYMHPDTLEQLVAAQE